MNILVTNDDGYQADGLDVLVKKLSQKHEVYVVAPDGNRSGASHSISMFYDHTISVVGEKRWAYSGNPADCVIVGLKSNLIDAKIDVVISGINHGANMGTDIIYSGTCSAAREGAVHDIPSLAVSLDKHAPVRGDFEKLADEVYQNLEYFVSLAKKTSFRCFVNINALPLAQYKGIKLTSTLSKRGYSDFIKIEEENGIYKGVFVPGDLTSSQEEDCDFMLAQKGYISVSLVKADPSALDVAGL